jgi:hypothetical protein
MTVADYCAGIDAKQITVNRAYQRSDKVWPPAARSFLIETILLGFPVPKFSLHQVTDLTTRTTRKEIVDGQQRTMAILEFFHGNLRLSPALDLEEAAGRRYEQLNPQLQARFMDYDLSIDLFVGTTPEQVREVFRRINAYTVPLNPEEQRHASHQGPFKWFIHRLARDLGDAFIGLRIFNEKQLVRMADAKLLTEIAHAYFFGISTTDKRKLNQLYKLYDGEFPQEADLDRRVRAAMDLLLSIEALRDTDLAKPFQAYSLLLAAMHCLEPIPTLVGSAPLNGKPVLEGAEVGIARLADAVETEDDEGPLAEFVKASSERTNVGSQREIRFQWFVRALRGELG